MSDGVKPEWRQKLDRFIAEINEVTAEVESFVAERNPRPASGLGYTRQITQRE